MATTGYEAHTHTLSRHTSRWHGPTNFDLLLLQQWLYSLFWFHHLNPYLFQYFFLWARVRVFSSSVPSSMLNSYWISSNIAHLNGRRRHSLSLSSLSVKHESWDKSRVDPKIQKKTIPMHRYVWIWKKNMLLSLSLCVSRIVETINSDGEIKSFHVNYNWLHHYKWCILCAISAYGIL